MSKTVFDEIKDLVTEARNPKTENIDRLSTREILELINGEDQGVAAAVAAELPQIAAAVDLIVEAMRRDGRLFYAGAGTSGRLGVLDAAECPPTYGTPPGLVEAVIAGGYKALVISQEGVEDIYEAGRSDLRERGFSGRDVLCGIAASQRTPYVLGALAYARELGAKTIYVICNPRPQPAMPVDVTICPVVGPEVVTGSTRMKAGTATKMVLNMLTTTTMIRLGKVYQNFMVDLQRNSSKLEERSKRTVMMVTGFDYERASEILDKADGHVKTALVMAMGGVDAAAARLRLERANGFVRVALEQPAS